MFESKVLVLVFVASCLSVRLMGATLFHTSDFEASNIDGWLHPVANANQTSIQMDGPTNNILLVTSSGGTGAGSRLVVPNVTAPWTGDYTAAGISAVRVDLLNNSGLSLSMRVAIEGAPGNRWVSDAPVNLNPGQSGTFQFGLDAGSLVSAGGSDLNAALGNVTQIRILHNSTSNSYLGARVVGSFTADNITLVPEPSVSVLFLAGASSMLLIRTQAQVRRS